MKQIVHIFAKDVRRLQIEILLSAAAAALFAWAEAKSLAGGPASVGNPYQGISGVMNPLVLLSWGVLIARLIHGEVLVGDRQFWITRPYEWPKLLTAKALFVALLLYLPFLLMQIAILLQAGFNPLSYIPGLLYSLLLISVFFFSLIGVAAATSNLARMVLTVLAVYLLLVASGSLASFFHFAALSYGNDGPVTYKYIQYGEPAAIAATLLLCGLAIVLLYARRRILVARLLLGSTPLLVLLAYAICVRSVSMDWAYPPAARTEPSVIRMIPFEQDEASRVAAGKWAWSEQGNFFNIDEKKWAVIKVRLRASSVAAGDLWQLNAFRPTLTPAHGARLGLDWQQAQQMFVATETRSQLNYFVLDFLIPRSDYDRLKSSPLTLHLDFALTQAKPWRSWRFPFPEGKFTIADLASCTSQEDSQRDITGLVCNYPLRTPVTSLTAYPTKGVCRAAPDSAGDPAVDISSTTGDFNTAPATFGISPLEQSMSMSFGTYNSENDTTPQVSSQLSRLCPGSPVAVTEYRKARAVQTGATIENFRLGFEY